MRTLQTLLDRDGGIEVFARSHCEIITAHAGDRTLEIRYMGLGTHGGPTVLAVEYNRMVGNIIRMPEMMFELGKFGWLPYFYRDDRTGEEYAAYTFYVGRHLFGINTELVEKMNALAEKWDEHIERAGFLEPKRTFSLT